MKTCAGCAHFHETDAGGGVGDCRRYPPVVLMAMETIGQDGPVTCFPEVGHDWMACGEFSEAGLCSVGGDAEILRGLTTFFEQPNLDRNTADAAQFYLPHLRRWSASEGVAHV